MPCRQTTWRTEPGPCLFCRVEREAPSEVTGLLVSAAGRVRLEAISAKKDVDSFGPQVFDGQPEGATGGEGGVDEWQHDHGYSSADALGEHVEGVGVGDPGGELADGIGGGWGDDDDVSMDRQRILYDETKAIRFVITEAALRWPLGTRGTAHDEVLAVTVVTGVEGLARAVHDNTAKSNRPGQELARLLLSGVPVGLCDSDRAYPG